MAISFKPLWVTLAHKGLTKKDLMEKCKIYPSTVSRMTHNQSVSLRVIERICTGLNCRIEHVVEITPDQPEEKQYT
ncbi:hypothetical protein B0W44_07735 [Novibacillus thermophilus]|uniref:HTH cro/C1-type domain-containing protein n=1 Tax=Novibacillus thermophilus TaxID=1471761 RepID=A0A1U9K6K9_9BACL|nr:hypothetical protein B0W44_07735 [Novibacillus thermophilus]